MPNTKEKEEEARYRKSDWHISQNLILTMIGAIVFNGVGGIWYASQLNSMVQGDHASMVALNNWKEKQDDEKSKIDSHLSVVDEKLSNQTKSLDHIIDILENNKPAIGKSR